MSSRAWVSFRRSDPSAVVAMVREVAASASAGAHGDGVAVVVDAPKPTWWRDLLGAEPAQARIHVTKADGEVSYPFHVRLVSDQGGNAGRRLPRRPGWATSNSAGLAYRIQKGRPGQAADWVELVDGAIEALTALRKDARDRGWRVRVQDVDLTADP